MYNIFTIDMQNVVQNAHLSLVQIDSTICSANMFAFKFSKELFADLGRGFDFQKVYI